jgi:RNA polymerase sigma-70 factor, ECF subfamily
MGQNRPRHAPPLRFGLEELGMTVTGDTRASLLLCARQGDEDAWRRLVDLYRPLVYAWLVRHQVATQDAEDLTQDVLAVVVKELGRFEHAGRPGAFRAWLRGITVNRARGFWRAGSVRAVAVGGSGILQRIDELADPASALSRQWDDEHDQHVVRRLLVLMEQEFEPATLRAFRRLTFDGASGQEVADELGLSLAAVYGAKSRVLRRLREEAAELLD